MIILIHSVEFSGVVNCVPSYFPQKKGQSRVQLIDSFHIVSAHAPNSLVPRYFREITREGATCIRLPYILHNGIWKTIKRKTISQTKIRQIVKLNDKCNKNK